MSIFSASTAVNPENLNKLISGNGSIQGLKLFSLTMYIKNNGGTMQYLLHTNSTTNDELLLSSIGATEESSYTNMGDGNVDRNGAGDYEINIDTVTGIFAIGNMRYTQDSNVVSVDVYGDLANELIVVRTKNNAGNNAEAADTKIICLHILGFLY